MLASVPGLHATRDLLLVVAIAAVMTGAGAFAAGLNLPGDRSASPAPIETSHLARSDCDCSRAHHLPATPRAQERRLTLDPASTPAMPPRRSRSIETGSMPSWMRAEADPRHMLSRMAMLSRHAPRSYAVEPPQS